MNRDLVLTEPPRHIVCVDKKASAPIPKLVVRDPDYVIPTWLSLALQEQVKFLGWKDVSTIGVTKEVLSSQSWKQKRFQNALRQGINGNKALIKLL